MKKNRTKKILYLFGNILFLILITGIISVIDKKFLENKFLYCLIIILIWLIFNFILKKLLDVVLNTNTNNMLDKKYIKYSAKFILTVLLMVFIADFWTTSSGNEGLRYLIVTVVFLLGNLAIEFLFNHC